MLQWDQFEVNMKILKSSVYQRLLAQADELKDRGLTKLSSNIVEALEDTQQDVDHEYSYRELQEDVNSDLWVAASRFISYYNLDRADAEKVQKALLTVASKLASEMEWALEVDDKSQTLEPKVPGEK